MGRSVTEQAAVLGGGVRVLYAGARAWFDGSWHTVSGQEIDRTGCYLGGRGVRVL